MVTLNNIREFGANRNVLDIVGLSTDTKPISTIESLTITNGGIFTEIDTANIFMFDCNNVLTTSLSGVKSPKSAK